MEKAKSLFGVGTSLFVAIVYTILVATFDRAAMGPEGTAVGFSHINGCFACTFGFNGVLYCISEILGYTVIASIMIFVVIGISQLIRTKKFSGVNTDIYMYGISVVLLGALYVFFEKVIVNYRPIILPGETEVEASFPSSHTMLACTILGISIVYVLRNVKNMTVRKVIVTVCACVAVILVSCRLFCGVHWLTDILGGLLWSVFVVCVYIRLCAVKMPVSLS